MRQLISKCFGATKHISLKCEIPICNKMFNFWRKQRLPCCRFLCERYTKEEGKDVADAEDNDIMAKEPTEWRISQFERRRIGRPFNICQHHLTQPAKPPFFLCNTPLRVLICKNHQYIIIISIIYAFDSAHVEYGVWIKAGLQPFFPAESGGINWPSRSKLN